MWELFFFRNYRDWKNLESDNHEKIFWKKYDEKNGGIVPVEVKAGNTASRSLNRFIELHHPETAYKLIDGNIGESEGKLTLPHYLAMFI